MSNGKPKKKLGEILVECGILSQEDCNSLLLLQKTSGKKLGELLVERGVCRAMDVAAALASQRGMQCVDLRFLTVDPEAVKLIPESLARKLTLVPVLAQEKDLYVAVADPDNFQALEDVRFVTGMNVKPLLATASDIHLAIGRYYGQSVSVDAIVNDLSQAKSLEVIELAKESKIEDSDIQKQVEAAPIVKIVNLIITKAVQEKASDIHLEPSKKDLTVRNRVDGALRVSMTLPKWVQGAVISRIKIMASMDIAEKRLPQDGKISIRVDQTELDLRVSTLPLNHGEKVVIRILDPKNVLIRVEELGLSGRNLKAFEDLIGQPQGILLVTGPTGSGKTTTLYTALSRIRSVAKNITTIEDPIEYELEGINQVGVNQKVGTNFAMFLRAVLRQDPDVIMVGEIRDVETAMIAMQASLTGHLVLSTLHTNNTVAAISRLRNLGIPSYMIASTISGIIAQRLARVNCAHCKGPDSPAPSLLDRLGLRSEDVAERSPLKGKGCVQCGNTGYNGRIAIYEMLVMTPQIRKLVTGEAPEAEIESMAISEGMETLSHAAREKVLNGISSVEEILRVVQTEDGSSTRPMESQYGRLSLIDTGVASARRAGNPAGRT